MQADIGEQIVQISINKRLLFFFFYCFL